MVDSLRHIDVTDVERQIALVVHYVNKRLIQFYVVGVDGPVFLSMRSCAFRAAGLYVHRGLNDRSVFAEGDFVFLFYRREIGVIRRRKVGKHIIERMPVPIEKAR